MILSLIAVLCLAVSPPALSPEAQAKMAPFLAAVEAAKAKQAVAQTDVRARLETLLEVDQEPLKALHKVGLSSLSAADRAAADALIAAEMSRISAANVQALVGMVPPEGWFSSKVYGDDAATGAFLIVQHADTGLQKCFLPAIEAFARRGEAKWSEYALMYDRIAVAEGRPQRYGTQMRCEGGRMVPATTEDPANLEARRAPMGFRWPTYADYLANFGAC